MKNNDCFNTFLYRETGIKHTEKGKGCEDNISTAYSEKNGVKVVTLSDGAGSYENAAIGSEMCSRIAAGLIASKFDLIYNLDSETSASYIIKEVRTPLEEEAKKNGNEL